MKVLMAAALFGLFLVGPAAADSYRYDRYENQQRIWYGARTGRLTPAEADRLSRQQRALDRQYLRDRRDGGGLSYRERRDLARKQYELDRRTYREMYDRDRR